MNPVINAYLAKAKEEGHKVFTDVTIYRANELFGTVSRIDCKFVVIQEGIEYAQYKNAIKVSFLEVRKRAALCFTLSYKPFLIVVPRKEAIKPLDWLVSQDDGSKVSRYSSHDERWESDMRAVLKEKGVTILADYEGWNSHDKFQMRCAHGTLLSAGCGDCLAAVNNNTQDVNEEPESVNEEPVCVDAPQAPSLNVPDCGHRRLRATDGHFMCRDCGRSV